MATQFTKNTLQYLFEKYNIGDLKKILDETSVYAEIILQYAFEDFVELSTRIKPYLAKLKEEMNTQDDINMQIKKQAMSDLNQIIVELQYHDIIRQKLEHIDQSYKQTLEEIDKTKDLDTIVHSMYLYIIPEISQLTIHQFQLIEQEYKEACTYIKNALKDIKNNQKIAQILDFKVTNTFNNIENLSKTIEQINKPLQEIVNAAKLNTDSFDELTLEKLKSVYKLYTMQSERHVFDKLFYGQNIVEEEEDIELF